MKNVPWSFWIMFLLVAGSGWGLWLHDRLAKPPPVPWVSIKQVSKNPSPSPSSPPNLYYHPPSTASTSPANRWQDYSTARQRVFLDHPELAADYQDLLKEMGSQRDKQAAAIISIDPKAAPILAKVESLAMPNAAVQQHPSNSSTVPPPGSHTSITPAEWHQLTTDRETVLRTHPELVKSAHDISQKMQDWGRKVNQAIVQENPTLAPMIARLEATPNIPPSMPPHATPAAVSAPESH